VLDSEPIELLRQLHRRTIGVIDEQNVVAGLEQAHEHRTDGGDA
jgi:hypothetical protein